MVTIWRGVARDFDDRPEWFFNVRARSSRRPAGAFATSRPAPRPNPASDSLLAGQRLAGGKADQFRRQVVGVAQHRRARCRSAECFRGAPPRAPSGVAPGAGSGRLTPFVRRDRPEHLGRHPRRDWRPAASPLPLPAGSATAASDPPRAGRCAHRGRADPSSANVTRTLSSGSVRLSLNARSPWPTDRRHSGLPVEARRG